MAVSLMVIESIEPSAGSMRIDGLRQHDAADDLQRDKPSARAARVWPGRIEAMPARTISAT